jgi:energy-converting hydrogenase Eha subunit C
MKMKWLLVLAVTIVLTGAFALVVAAQPVTVTLNGERMWEN